MVLCIQYWGRIRVVYFAWHHNEWTFTDKINILWNVKEIWYCFIGFSSVGASSFQLNVLNEILSKSRKLCCAYLLVVFVMKLSNSNFSSQGEAKMKHGWGFKVGLCYRHQTNEFETVMWCDVWMFFFFCSEAHQISSKYLNA